MVEDIQEIVEGIFAGCLLFQDHLRIVQGEHTGHSGKAEHRDSDLRHFAPSRGIETETDVAGGKGKTGVGSHAGRFITRIEPQTGIGFGIAKSPGQNPDRLNKFIGVRIRQKFFDRFIGLIFCWNRLRRHVGLVRAHF